MSERPVHPAAALFPMLPDDELQALADDIEANGLHEPITLTADGMLLDGRNRAAACALAGIEPATVVYTGDPVAFVISANVHRRHMSTGSRAMAAALVLDAAGKRENGRWKRGSIPVDIGKLSDSGWPREMAKAGTVLDFAPDLADGVIAGLALDAAYQTAIARRDKANSDEALMERLAADAPDLAAQVTEERLTLSEAVAANAARERKRAEERRDARALLIRILDLVTPSDGVSAGFIDAWAGRMGDVESTLVDRLDTAIDVLTQLAKRVQS